MIGIGGPNVFVTAMFRSGSTHISRGLSDMLRFRPASIAGMHGEGSDQHVMNMYTAAVLMPYGYQVFHQHTWGTNRTVGIMRDMRIRPIICTRNILDTVVSLKERIDHLYPNCVIPGIQLPLWDETWDDDDKYFWLVYHAVPWQLQFLSSWSHNFVPKHIVTFDEHFKNQRKSFRAMLDFLERDLSPTVSNDTIDKFAAHKQLTNFNKGVSGRGGKLVPRKLQDVVLDMAHSWKVTKCFESLL